VNLGDVIVHLYREERNMCII